MRVTKTKFRKTQKLIGEIVFFRLEILVVSLYYPFKQINENQGIIILGM